MNQIMHQKFQLDHKIQNKYLNNNNNNMPKKFRFNSQISFSIMNRL